MPEAPRIRRALLSAFDKTGLVPFARTLHEAFGVELVSTGGTAAALREAGLPVTLVETITGFPEMLDGRVKTLHPRIHAAILADRDNPEHMRQLAEQGIEPIDLVAVNLYPFEQTVSRPGCGFADAIEMIDIGGPCLLRAAAKNHAHVLVLHDPADWERLPRWLRDPSMTEDDWRALRRRLAASAFRLACRYNAAITDYLLNGGSEEPWFRAVLLERVTGLRYGENPHQRGYVFRADDQDPACEPSCLRGSGAGGQAEVELSYNNYVDAGAALELCSELARAPGLLPGDEPPAVCCFIKHTNACGVAVDADPLEAYRRAYLGDPNAAMGGILAVNFRVEADFAAAVMETLARWGKPLKEAGAAWAPGAFFVEVWVAPAFDEEAVRIIRGENPGGPKKKWGRRVRLLEVGDMRRPPDAGELEIKRIRGGTLLQTRDVVGLDEAPWRVVSRRQPTEEEWRDLRLAWLVCKHTKSNAITICRDGTLLGSGAGQMSRVMSCRIATWLARENGHAEALQGAVAASDAFFPFRDGPDVLADAGVRAVIQPGGSKNDEQVIAACDERGLALVFTGTRHFRH